MSMSPEQEEQFSAVAELFYKDAATLSKGLAPELNRASKASAEMDHALLAGRDQSKTSEVRAEFDDLMKAQAAIYTAFQEIVSKAQQQLGDLKMDPQIPIITGDKAIEKRKVFEFNLAIVHFFHGCALTGMQAGLESHLGLCEAYLGHEVGSHNWRNRIVPVLTEVGPAAVALIPGLGPVGLLPAVKEGIIAIRDSTQRTDAEYQIRLAEGRDRQVLLKRSLDTASRNAEYIAGMTDIAVDGVVSGRSAFAELLINLGVN
jgi:hypothetical protein